MIAELQQLKPTVRNNYLCPITTFTCAHTPKKSQVEVVHVPEKPPMRKFLSSQFDSPQPDNVSVTAESDITWVRLLSLRIRQLMIFERTIMTILISESTHREEWHIAVQWCSFKLSNIQYERQYSSSIMMVLILFKNSSHFYYRRKNIPVLKQSWIWNLMSYVYPSII